MIFIVSLSQQFSVSHHLSDFLSVSGQNGICRYISSLAYLNELKSLILVYFNALRSLILAHFNALRFLILQDLSQLYERSQHIEMCQNERVKCVEICQTAIISTNTVM